MRPPFGQGGGGRLERDHLPFYFAFDDVVPRVGDKRSRAGRRRRFRPGHSHTRAFQSGAGALFLLAQRRDACPMIPFDASLLGCGLPRFRVQVFLLDLLAIGAGLILELLAGLVDLIPPDRRVVAPSYQRPWPGPVCFPASNSASPSLL